MHESESTSLSAEPAGELRIAVELQAFGEVSGKQPAHRMQLPEIECLDAGSQRAFHLRDVDEAVGQIERNLIAGRMGLKVQ